MTRNKLKWQKKEAGLPLHVNELSFKKPIGLRHN